MLRVLAGVRGALPRVTARARLSARAPHAPLQVRPRAGAGAA